LIIPVPGFVDIIIFDAYVRNRYETRTQSIGAKGEEKIATEPEKA
jgi:hypothetical protein